MEVLFLTKVVIVNVIPLRVSAHIAYPLYCIQDISSAKMCYAYSVAASLAWVVNFGTMNRIHTLSPPETSGDRQTSCTIMLDYHCTTYEGIVELRPYVSPQDD